jgi:GST-like protein
MLEECGLPYTIKPVNIGRGDQLSSTFLRISPNGRTPVIVDREPISGGGPITIFESDAIVMYLGEKTRKFWPQESHLKYEVCQWILWQAANQGLKFGEQGYFRRAAQDSKHGDLSFPLLRFDNEVHVSTAY